MSEFEQSLRQWVKDQRAKTLGRNIDVSTQEGIDEFVEWYMDIYNAAKPL